MVRMMPILKQEEIDRLVRGYFEERMLDANELLFCFSHDPDIDHAEEAIGFQDALERLKREAIVRSFSGFVAHDARKLAEKAGVPNLPRHTEEFENLCHGVQRALIEENRILLANLTGDFPNSAPKDPLFEGLNYQSLPPLPDEEPVSKDLSVDALARKFCDYKGKHEWAPKTLGDYQRVLGWFKELVGAEKIVTNITVDDVRAFRDVILRLPSNLSKSKKYQGLPLLEVAKLETEEKCIGPKTARKYLHNLKTFLNWCVDEQYIAKNPAGTLSIKLPTKSEDARDPYSNQQLERLFKSPQYTGHKSPSRRSIPGEVITKDGKYWVPLVALFTGMRMSEIIQMQVKDIQAIDGIHCFTATVRGADDKSLKSPSSKRIVPIHPKLKELGFLGFVAKRQSEDPAGRIFGDIKKGHGGSFSHNFSKYYGRYARQVGVHQTGTAFHSFRHNFTDALIAAEAEDSQIRALLGHSDQTMMAVYKSKIPANVLYGVIERVKYDIDLDHLLCQDEKNPS